MNKLTWKKGIPEKAGHYFFSINEKEIDIPRYCKVRHSEVWGHIKHGHFQYLEIDCPTFEHIRISYFDDGNISYELVRGYGLIGEKGYKERGIDVNEWYFYGPIRIPKEI